MRELEFQVGDQGLLISFATFAIGFHNIFHVSLLRKYILELDHILSLTPLQIQDLSYKEHPEIERIKFYRIIPFHMSKFNGAIILKVRQHERSRSSFEPSIHNYSHTYLVSLED